MSGHLYGAGGPRTGNGGGTVRQTNLPVSCTRNSHKMDQTQSQLSISAYLGVSIFYLLFRGNFQLLGISVWDLIMWDEESSGHLSISTVFQFNVNSLEGSILLIVKCCLE